MKLLPLLPLVCGIGSLARADWRLNDYAKVTADSTMTNAVYGIQSFQNKSSAVTVKVATAGAISLIATTIASDSTEGYTANIGMIHPITPDWTAFDLTGLESVDFEFKNTDKITDYFAVSFGSDAYGDAITKAGTVYEAPISGTTALSAGTTWKPGSVAVADFATPSWWTDIPKDFPTIDDVLKEVKYLRFAPKTKYSDSGSQNGTACKTCVGPTMTKITLDLRNITLVASNIHRPFNPPVIICPGPGIALDDTFDDGWNTLGKPWFRYSDQDSTNTSADARRGRTTSSHFLTPGDSLTSGITLQATLDRRIGGVRHAMAGWAGVGTEIVDSSSFPLQDLAGISFHISSQALPARIEVLDVYLDSKGSPDSLAHVVRIPRERVLGDGDNFCLRPEDARQQGYIRDSLQFVFDPAKLRGIRWEATLAYYRDTVLDTAVVSFKVGNVRLHAKQKVGIARAVKPGSSLQATCRNGVLALKGITGFEHLEIRTLDGRRIQTFAPTERLAIQLPRGTYLLRGTGKGKTSSFRFTTVGF